MNIRQQSHITDLFAACNIRDPYDVVNLRKLKLYCRLLNNPTTHEIITEENNEFHPDENSTTFIADI